MTCSCMRVECSCDFRLSCPQALTPALAAPLLDAGQLKLYTLIWQRAVGSQMESADIDNVKVRIGREIG
eukprot:4750554-Pyramimonas_sp.AAC.1